MTGAVSRRAALRGLVGAGTVTALGSPPSAAAVADAMPIEAEERDAQVLDRIFSWDAGSPGYR